MSWTPERLVELMTVFGVSAIQVSKDTNIPMNSIYQMRNSIMSFEIHGKMLDIYFEALKQGKIHQLNLLIEFYKSV